MNATPDKPTPALSTLCDMLDVAHQVARDVRESADPTYTELIESLAATRVCARRLAAERVGASKRAPSRA